MFSLLSLSQCFCLQIGQYGRAAGVLVTLAADEGELLARRKVRSHRDRGKEREREREKSTERFHGVFFPPEKDKREEPDLRSGERERERERR